MINWTSNTKMASVMMEVEIFESVVAGVSISPSLHSAAAAAAAAA